MSAAVAVGDVVEVWGARDPERADPRDVARVLAEREGLVIAYKPPSLPTTADRRGSRSLVAELARLLGAEPHPASRLDVGVSGVVLCALDAPARQHVAAMKESGQVRRVYVAIAGGSIEGSGTWSAPIGRASGPGKRARPTVFGEAAEPAETRFEAVATGRSARPGAEPTTLLRLQPVTGRMHQLRVHSAHAGAPVLGDREHGGARVLVAPSGEITSIDRIALHALTVAIPVARGDLFSATAPLPGDLAALWKKLDGSDSAWEEVARRDG